ncbi:MAG: ATP-binding protein [Thermodesulfobacteriota bacterium]|nr:ATP-binding protein [Thermodesulfobacteriota bacterium]
MKADIIPLDSRAQPLPLTIWELTREEVTVPPDTLVQDVKDMFSDNEAISSIVVVNPAGEPMGLVMSLHLHRQLSRRFGVALYSHKPIEELMDADPLIVSVNCQIEEAAQAAMARSDAQIYDHIIVVEDSQLAGVVSVKRIMDALVALHKNRAGEYAILNRKLKAEAAERRHAQKEMEVYERMVAASDDYMALVDRHHVFRAVNDAYLKALGKSRPEIVNRHVREVFGEDFYDRVQKDKIEKCLTGQSVRYQTWLPSPALGERYMDIAYYPHYDKSGAIAGYVVNSRDITEQKKMEETFRQAHKMDALGTLAGGIAHDINNILASIFGYAELSLVEANANSELSDHLQRILQAGNRAKELVNQILAFSRQTEQEFKPIQLRLIAKEVFKLIRASLPAFIEVRQNIVSDAVVMGDPTQFHQVLMNLCTNAGHAMEENGGTLTISLTETHLDSDFLQNYPELKPGNYLKLTVSDTGHGIPPHNMSRIFDPFFTTKEQGKGTGMGLAVVHGIISNHQGIILAASDPGQGTEFSVYLPCLEKEEQADPQADTPIPRGTERILFVDDEKTLVEVVRMTLESLGYTVDTRSDSRAALNAYKQNPGAYDLVISDMTMPHMTGDKLARALLAITPSLPIILCTGYSKKIDEEKARQIGIRTLIPKPLLRKDLALAVRSALDGSP